LDTVANGLYLLMITSVMLLKQGRLLPADEPIRSLEAVDG